MNNVIWYYGFGKVLDQGGYGYPGPMNFGTSSIEAFLMMLGKELEYAMPDIKRLAQERVDEGNDKGPV